MSHRTMVAHRNVKIGDNSLRVPLLVPGKAERLGSHPGAPNGIPNISEGAPTFCLARRQNGAAAASSTLDFDRALSDCCPRQHTGQRMTQDEATLFIFEKLAELLGAVVDDHVVVDAVGLDARADVRAVLIALGNFAARNGRPDLLSILHGAARRLMDEADPKCASR